MQELRILLVFLYFLLGGIRIAGAGELEERQAVRALAEQAYEEGDFDSLERQHAAYSDFLRERTSSGAFKMTLFFDGIADARRTADEVQLVAYIARTSEWVRQHRRSPIAHVLHADALMAYGGHFRGDGYIDTVPAPALKIWKDYNQRAGKFLLESESEVGSSSIWKAWMLNLARVNGWPKAVLMKLYDDGARQDPGNFMMYRNVLEYLLPKWYGSEREVDEFIRMASFESESPYGLELYARLYSAAEETQFHRQMYSNSPVDWSLMKRGLALWVQRFPTAWNRNIAAYHACIAGDHEETRKWLAGIGDTPEWEIWQPNAEATFRVCTRWAAAPPPEAGLHPGDGS